MQKLGQKVAFKFVTFGAVGACARLLLRPDPASASEGGRSRPETPQGDTQVSLQQPVRESLLPPDSNLVDIGYRLKLRGLKLQPMIGRG